jgi:GNAT superfamily N-acetyltransferase
VTGKLLVRPAVGPDRAWLLETITRRWGAPVVVSRGRAHDAACLPAIVAELGGQRVGLATYLIEGGEAELVTLDALVPQQGVGTALLKAVVDRASAAGCRRLWLVTSNDNIDAIRFYQRRGLRLAAVHKEAIDEARRLKPQIPALGHFGIPVHDEVELELVLGESAGTTD